MRTIVVAWEFGSGLGHVGRLSPIVATLVERGHNIIVVGRDVGLCHRTLERFGVKIVQAPILPKANPRIRIPCTFADVLHDSGYRQVENLIAAVSAWRYLFELIAPDLVLADHSPTALLASRGQKVKSAALGTGFLCPPNVSPLPSLRDSVPKPSWAAEIEELILSNMNATLDRTGGARLQHVAQLYADVDRTFLMTLPEIDHYANRLGAAYLRPVCEMVGEKPSWPNSGGSRVFVYLKDHSGLMSVLQMLARAEFSFLCFVPELDPIVENRLASVNFRAVRQPQDIRAAAEQCDVAVTNGGHGAICEFLLAGKPVLVLPMTLEQQVTGQRVADVGAGAIASLRNPIDVLDALRQLVSVPEFTRAAQAISARYAHLSQEDSRAAIAGALEQTLDRCE